VCRAIRGLLIQHEVVAVLTVIRVALIGLVIGGIASAGAQSIDYDEREEGWFWCHDPALLEEEEPEPSEEPMVMLTPIEPTEPPEPEILESDQSQDEPAPLSAAWLRTNLPKALERAIDDPGPDNINIRQYLYMQRALLDKAERFAREAQRVSLSDPVLDENNRYPITQFASRAMYQEKQEDRDKRLRWLAEHAGFFYFHDKTCKYCAQQLPLLERIKEDYGLEIVAVSVDNSILQDTSLPTQIDSGQARRFQIQSVPAIAMVFPPDNVAILSQSIITRRGFENRALAIAEEMDLLTPEVDEELGVERLQYAGKTAPDAERISIDDPSVFINHVRSELGYEPIDE